MHAAPKHPAAPLDWRPVAALKKWAKNPKKHGPANLAAITASIEAFGFVAPVVIWGSQSRIIAGHGRITAALDLMRADPARLLAPDAPGPGLVPVRVVEFSSEAQAAAYALADNRLTEMEPMQAVDVAEVLRQIQEETGEVAVPGWTDAEIAAMLGETAVPAGEGGDKYTNTIKLPTYEPTQEKPPPISDLYNAAKSADLRREIDAAGLPPDIAAFLRIAADRHTSFHFRNIAEFYAHASPEVQRLMERSALVIIDVDDAIAGGFVRLTDRLTELAGIEAADEG